MPPSNANTMDESKVLKEAKEVSPSGNTLATSPLHEGLGKTDSELKTDAELQQVEQSDETISYPGGLKLFLLA
jgi:hypothetical protein